MFKKSVVSFKLSNILVLPLNAIVNLLRMSLQRRPYGAAVPRAKKN